MSVHGSGWGKATKAVSQKVIRHLGSAEGSATKRVIGRTGRILYGAYAAPCFRCNGSGSIPCGGCIGGSVFVTTGYDYFGNPLGYWTYHNICGGTGFRACPGCQ